MNLLKSIFYYRISILILFYSKNIISLSFRKVNNVFIDCVWTDVLNIRTIERRTGLNRLI